MKIDPRKINITVNVEDAETRFFREALKMGKESNYTLKELIFACLYCQALIFFSAGFYLTLKHQDYFFGLTMPAIIVGMCCLLFAAAFFFIKNRSDFSDVFVACLSVMTSFFIGLTFCAVIFVPTYLFFQWIA